MILTISAYPLGDRGALTATRGQPYNMQKTGISAYLRVLALRKRQWWRPSDAHRSPPARRAPKSILLLPDLATVAKLWSQGDLKTIDVALISVPSADQLAAGVSEQTEHLCRFDVQLGNT